MKKNEIQDNHLDDIKKALIETGQKLKIKEEVILLSKQNIMNRTRAETRKRRHYKFIPSFATALLLVFSMLATSVLAFPGVAAKVASGMPLVKELSARNEQLDELSEKVEEFREADEEKQEVINSLMSEIEELKIKIKEISDEKIKEVETSPNEDEAQNMQLQTLVVEFVKEMYRGNYEKAAEYCTAEFAKVVLKNPGDVIMRPDSNAIVFTQITNVARTEDGVFLVFLRLNDSGEDMEADYQLDFEIVQSSEGYLISFVGIDA